MVKVPVLPGRNIPPGPSTARSNPPGARHALPVAALWLTLSLALAMMPPALADGPVVRATVDANKIGQEDTVTLQVTVEGDTDAEILERPSSADFVLVAGPSTSSQFQFVNGRASSKKIFTFVFSPQKTGALTLPAVKVRVGGNVQATQPVAVEVVPGTLGRSRAARQPRSPFDLFDDYEQEPQQPADPGRDVVVRLESSPARVFIGQPVTVDLVIYYRVNVMGLEIEKEGKFENFWVESADPGAKNPPQQSRRQLDGQVYYAQTVRQWVLFPMTAGTRQLDPWSVKLLVQAAARSFFSFDRRQVVIRRTNPVSIEVLDFPAAGRPAEFNGLCGRFEFTAAVDKQKVPAGEGVNLKVTLSGEGNLRSLSELPPLELDRCKVYTPKTREDIRLAGGTLRGSRAWEFILVPLEPGTLRVPALPLAYFDPAAGAYRRLASPPLSVEVAGQAVDGAVPLSPAGVALPLELKGRDIRYIATGASLWRTRKLPVYRQPWFGAAFAGILLATLAVGAWDERRRRLRHDAREWARSRAAVQARRALKGCARLGRKGFSDAFFQELYRILQDYLESRYGLNRIALTGAGLRQSLAGAGLPEEPVEGLIQLYQLCESHRYAPAALAQQDPETVLATVRQVLEQLERGQS